MQCQYHQTSADGQSYVPCRYLCLNRERIRHKIEIRRITKIPRPAQLYPIESLSGSGNGLSTLPFQLHVATTELIWLNIVLNLLFELFTCRRFSKISLRNSSINFPATFCVKIPKDRKVTASLRLYWLIFNAAGVFSRHSLIDWCKWSQTSGLWSLPLIVCAAVYWWFIFVFDQMIF